MAPSAFSIGFFANPDYDAVITPGADPASMAANPPRFERLEYGEAMVYLYSRHLAQQAAGPRRRAVA